MDTKEVLKAIDDALGQFKGEEVELMEALVQLADGWQMRLDELREDGD